MKKKCHRKLVVYWTTIDRIFLSLLVMIHIQNQRAIFRIFNAYRHSKDLLKTVREARKKSCSLDHLIIFAGACQSHFESLIQAGANFASSPSRVNIHALDPVYIVGKISFTPFREHHTCMGCSSKYINR